MFCKIIAFLLIVIGSTLALEATTTPAAAEQFSIECIIPDLAEYYLTFDTDLRRAIYEDLASPPPRRGNITSFEADGIHFSIYNIRPAFRGTYFNFAWNESAKKVAVLGPQSDPYKSPGSHDCRRVPLRPVSKYYDKL